MEASGVRRFVAVSAVPVGSVPEGESRPALEPKWSYRAPLVQPAFLLTRSSEVA